MATITAANSVFMLAIASLYPVPQRLQGYAADAAFATDAVDTAETVMGVDGRMSVGWVPYLIRQTITLMPDSPSADMFDAWLSAEKTAQDKYIANGTITLPSLGKEFLMTRGVLTNMQPIPGVQRTLQARTFVITWESIAPVGI